VDEASAVSEFYLPVSSPGMSIVSIWRLLQELRGQVQVNGTHVLKENVLIVVSGATQEVKALEEVIKQVSSAAQCCC
jgi:hypothetical protein